MSGLRKKAGAPSPWCWGRGNRAQRAAFSKPATYRVRARLHSSRKKAGAPRPWCWGRGNRAKRAAFSKPATYRVRARLHSSRKKRQTWLARVSILRPGNRAERAAFSKPATHRVRARLHSSRKKAGAPCPWCWGRGNRAQTGVPSAPVVGVMGWERAAFSKPATHRVRARLLSRAVRIAKRSGLQPLQQF